MSRSAQHHKVTLEAWTNEPALTGAVFDLLRLHARACGLPDVEHVQIHLSLEVGGYPLPHKLEELNTRLDALWLGQVSKVEVTEVSPQEEAA